MRGHLVAELEELALVAGGDGGGGGGPGLGMEAQGEMLEHDLHVVGVGAGQGVQDRGHLGAIGAFQIRELHHGQDGVLRPLGRASCPGG